MENIINNNTIATKTKNKKKFKIKLIEIISYGILLAVMAFLAIGIYPRPLLYLSGNRNLYWSWHSLCQNVQ